ncbi:MAG: hypothetical protein GF384_07400, partial [Elusimicrobia bacterium]|nr:hypothetical protein [Elusimicrobiota bacterium]MBD3412482.1 hypothetical protein [Elusimicrobiota bacterium]
MKNLKNPILKLTKKALLITLYVCLVAITGVHASFEDLGMGARATGMSNAFTAAANDAYSVYYNPAGLNNLEYPELSSTYGKLLMGLDDDSDLGTSFLVYSHPLRSSGRSLGTIALAWQEFKLNSMYKENALYLSYARTIMPRFLFGMNLKQLRREFGTDAYTENAIDQNGNALGSKDPVFDGGRSKKAFGIDLGFQAKLGLNDEYVLGLSILNINQP